MNKLYTFALRLYVMADIRFNYFLDRAEDKIKAFREG